MRTCAICHAPDTRKGVTCAYCGEASWHPVESNDEVVTVPGGDDIPIIDAFPLELSTAPEALVSKSKRQMKREGREAAKAAGTITPDAPTSDADVDDDVPETLGAPPDAPDASAEVAP